MRYTVNAMWELGAEETMPELLVCPPPKMPAGTALKDAFILYAASKSIPPTNPFFRNATGMIAVYMGAQAFLLWWETLAPKTR